MATKRPPSKKPTSTKAITAAQVRRLTAQLERRLSIAWIRVDRRTLKLTGIDASRKESRARRQPNERVLRVGLRVNRVPV